MRKIDILSADKNNWRPFLYRHTFEVSPVFSVAETVIIQHMKSLLGFDGDGTFCPGIISMSLLHFFTKKIYKDVRRNWKIL